MARRREKLSLEEQREIDIAEKENGPFKSDNAKNKYLANLCNNVFIKLKENQPLNGEDFALFERLVALRNARVKRIQSKHNPDAQENNRLKKAGKGKRFIKLFTDDINKIKFANATAIHKALARATWEELSNKAAYKQSNKIVYANTTLAKDLGITIPTLRKATKILENQGMLKSVSAKNDAGENEPMHRTLFSEGDLSGVKPKGKKAVKDDDAPPGTTWTPGEF